MRPVASRQPGFTLVEALVVVALLAIVAGLAAPAFRSLIATMNTKATAFDVISDLTQARSEAIKRNGNTTVTPVAGDWAKGWTVAAGATLLRQRGASGSGISIAAPGAGVTFGPSGRIGADTADSNLTWTVSSTIAGVASRCVIVTPTGAARSKTGRC